VVVGEAPGAGTPEADLWKGGNWTGMAYTARHSGRKIRELFADLGFDGDDLYFTNAVKCFPEGEEGSNREPSRKERANCRPYLEAEITDIEPRTVIGTGKHATTSLLATEGRSLDGFVDSILEPVALDGLGTTLVPILHPSYQAVWLSRLDYTYEGYLDAIAETLAAVE
jgi:uracil-DNA glycosylase family 4